MFTISIDPIIFQIGPFALVWLMLARSMDRASVCFAMPFVGSPKCFGQEKHARYGKNKTGY